MKRRVSAGSELEQIQRHLDGLMTLLAAPRQATATDWSPAVDLLQHSDRYLVRVDVPGVSVRELVISLREQELRVAGRKLPASEHAGRRRCHHMERGFGPFAVEVLLPGPVNPESARAWLHDGVLEISLPRQLERRDSVHMISITEEGP